jgi:DNA-directed RNA polymerase specialized sigma24 family protein
MAGRLEDLFRAHWLLVNGYLVRRTGDPVLAEELAQETFYRATRAFLGWRGGSAVAWLLAIARHVLIDEVRRGRRLVPLPDSLVAGIEPGGGEDVARVLASLPKAQRQVLELIYIYGYSHAEAAAILGTSEGAVKTAVWRARSAFRRAYLGEDAPVSDSVVKGSES